MSSSLLYHGLGIRGYRQVRTRFQFGAMIVEMELPAEKRRCACCGSSDVHSRGTTTRLFRGVPIGKKPVFVELGNRTGAPCRGGRGENRRAGMRYDSSDWFVKRR